MRSGWVRVNGVCTWRGDLTLPTILERTRHRGTLPALFHRTCSVRICSSIFSRSAISAFTAGIGAGNVNVRPLPFLDQFLDVDSQPIISGTLHYIYIA